jgi:L-iditol 2-dehydrogenase
MRLTSVESRSRCSQAKDTPTSRAKEGMLPAMAVPPPPERILVAACAAAGSVQVECRPTPRPGPGEVLLRLHCAGLCGTDLWKLRHGTAEAGSVLGHEVVGSVVELGAGPWDAGAPRPGDRLFVPHHVACGRCELCRAGSETMCPAFAENQLAPGGFSDHLAVRARGVAAALRLPPELPDESAVFLEPAACVLRGFRRAGLGRDGGGDARSGGDAGSGGGGASSGGGGAGGGGGDARSDSGDAGGGSAAEAGTCIAVLGAGGMGLLHVLVGKALHPGLRIVVCEPIAARRETALRLGADAAAPPGGPARRAVEELSGGRGAAAVFDTAGGAAATEAALALGRPGGTVVLFAHAAAGERAGFEINRLFKSERRLIATYSSAASEQREVFSWLLAGRLDPSPLVSHRLPLSRIAEAVELAAGQRALKVLLHPDSPPSAALDSGPDRGAGSEPGPGPGPGSEPGHGHGPTLPHVRPAGHRGAA